MRMSLKVILAATAVAALASPVMAQSDTTRPHARHSANISNAQGSVAHIRAVPVAPVVGGGQFHINDAEHVAFPQDGNGN